MMALINHQCAACFFETDERYERWDVVCIRTSPPVTHCDCDFTTDANLYHARVETRGLKFNFRVTCDPIFCFVHIVSFELVSGDTVTVSVRPQGSTVNRYRFSAVSPQGSVDTGCLSVGLRASDSLDTLRIEKKLNLNGQPSTVVGHTQQMQIEFSWHFAVLDVMFNFLDDANETGMLLINPQVATAHAKGHAA